MLLDIHLSPKTEAPTKSTLIILHSDNLSFQKPLTHEKFAPVSQQNLLGRFHCLLNKLLTGYF